MTKPNINVTPLIDVLLVLLIIFMIVSHATPTDLKTKLPFEQKDKTSHPNPLALVIAVDRNRSLRINRESDFGTVDDTGKLVAKLSEVFADRSANGVFDDADEKIQKTVFIKAPSRLPYGDVVKVVDAVRIAGAEPVSLQIDDIE